MRILFIHNYYQQRGGEDMVFEQEVEALREYGYSVETVEFTNEGFDGSLLGNLTSAINSLYSSKSVRRVELAIDSFRPDVVHIHNLFYVASPAVIRAAKRRGIPVVMTLHNYRLICNSGMLSRETQIPCERCLTKTIPLEGIKYRCFRESRIESAHLTAITSLHKLTGTWQSVDRFIVLTDFAKEKILGSSLKLRPEQLVVKPNYINELGFTDIIERQNYFLYVGRLHYEKGIQSLIKSAYLNQLPLEIVGDGPLRSLVEKAAEDLPHLTYHGPLSRLQVIKKMKECKALVVPSIWYEGLPTTILEAFSTGTPVLCSDQKNLNSIITHKRTGILFKTDDPISIASAMSSLSEIECSKYAKAGYQVFKEKYTKKKVIDSTCRIYSSLIKINTITANTNLI